MGGFISQVLSELVGVFLEASPYILLGFTVAAGIQILLPVQAVRRMLGSGRIRPVVVASLLGIPLPLCSCSVLPTALALRKRGATRGATISFLVSTPETGVDSIALTWGLMDPLMAIFRPFAALVTALTAGFAVEALGDEDEDEEEKAADEPVDCGCGPETESTSGHTHSHDKIEAEERAEEETRGLSLTTRLRRGFRGAFVEIFDETSHWMLAGLIISALIAVLLPAEIVTRYLSSGPIPILLMLAIGIPLYICASASTPIAAALVLKGLSPGAALVFLLAGPATNIGSLAILSRTFGRRVMAIYIGSIAVLSVVLGVLLDAVYGALEMDPGAAIGEMKNMSLWMSVPAAVIFGALLLVSFRRTALPGEFRSLIRGVEWLTGLQFNRRLGWGLLGVAAVLVVAAQCVVQVPPGNHALIRRFGAPHGGALGEGLHLKFPPPIDAVEFVHTDRVRRIEIGFRSGTSDSPAPLAPESARGTRGLEDESVFITGDENLLSTRAVVQYRVMDPARFAWGFRDPERTLKLETIAEVLEVLAAQDIDGVYTGSRAHVEQLVLEGVRRRAQELGLGVEILQYCVRDVHAPPEVHAAFRDVASAQEDKQTAINVALRFLDESVNLARGEAVRTLEEARALSVGDVLRAEGTAISLKARADAYQESRTGTYTRLYLETVEEVLAGSRKIIRPGWGGSGNVDLWISNGPGSAAPVTDIIRGSDVRRDESERVGE